MDDAVVEDIEKFREIVRLKFLLVEVRKSQWGRLKRRNLQDELLRRKTKSKKVTHKRSSKIVK